MKKILSTIIAGLMISSCIGISAFAADPTYINQDSQDRTATTNVKADVKVAYTVIIPSSVDFGTIKRSSVIKSMSFPIKVSNAILEEGYFVKVQNKTTDMNMYADNKGAPGNKPFPFLLHDNDGKTDDGILIFNADDFSTANPSKTIPSTVTCNLADLQVAGSYTGTMTFTVSYTNVL